MKLKFNLDSETFETSVELSHGDTYLVKLKGKTYKVKKFRTSLGLLLKEGNQLFEIAAKTAGGSNFDVFVNNEPHRVSLETSVREIESTKVATKPAKAKKEVFSPLFGVVNKIFVEKGQPVKKGQKLCSITSMKMENLVLATHDTVVAKVFVEKGQRVAEDQILMRFG